jgi:hypothetical protein
LSGNIPFISQTNKIRHLQGVLKHRHWTFYQLSKVMWRDVSQIVLRFYEKYKVERKAMKVFYERSSKPLADMVNRSTCGNHFKP